MTRVGDRVRMVGMMPNDPCPMDVGAEGTVTLIGDVLPSAWGGSRQIFVDWDNGRSLILLDTDPFIVIGSVTEPEGNEP